MFVREATPEELSAVLGICNGAALEVDRERVTSRIERGDTLVAVSDDGDRILGTLVLDGGHIEAIAVRRRRRGQGIGTALVTAASDRYITLTATFDQKVRPFYERLGFAIEPAEQSDRFRGRQNSDH
jgi:GNAT superfamily N-acetyltransferase